MLEDLEDLGQRFNFEASMLEHRFNFEASMPEALEVTGGR